MLMGHLPQLKSANMVFGRVILQVQCMPRSVALSLETILVAVAFPETIKPELRTSTRKLVMENWRVPCIYRRHETHASSAERYGVRVLKAAF